MLSYQHSYHAGNFADVQKHATLCLLLKALSNKEKPFFVLDAFAGRGTYILDSDDAQKTGEYHHGIAKVWPNLAAPIHLADYFDAVSAINPEGKLQYYPGSPWIIRHLLRPQDRMALCELHPGEFEELRKNMASEKQVRLYKQNAFEGLKAHLPPKERRGLLLLDPSYENKDEYRTIAESTIQTYKHWREGTYAIWYPILSQDNHLKLRSMLKNSGIRKILDYTLTLYNNEQGMNGSGMIVINPPWHLDEQLKELSPWLCKQMQDNEDSEVKASFEVRWLVPE